MPAQTSLFRVVGTPTKNAWSQVHKFTPLDPGKTTQRGEFYAALSFNDTTLPSVELGHEVLTRLNEEFFGPDEVVGTPFDLLQKAVSSVGQEFGGTTNLEIICAVAWNSFIYLCVFGRGNVLLWRGGKLVSLLSGESPQADGMSIVSGQVKEGDVFILATSAFSQIINKESLSGLFAQFEKINDVVDNIAPLVHRSSLPTVAAGIIKISEDMVPVSQVVAQPDIPVARRPVSGNQEPKKPFFKSLLVSLAEKLPEEVNTTTYKISSSGRKTAVSVGVLLLFLFGLSIAFGLKQKKEHEYRLSYQEQLVQAETALGESLLQKDVDQVRARELFLQAKQIGEELTSRGVKDKKLEELMAQISGNAGSVLGEIEGTASVFLDLSLVRSGIVASQITLDGETLAILDSGGQRIVSTSEEKETVVIGGPEKLDSPRAVAVYAGRYFSLSDKGVVELDKKGAVGATLAPDDWGDVTKIGVFGGNLYLLDRGANEIWRYAGVGGEFADKQRWLGTGVTPDFSDVLDIAIDGSIWVLHQDGSVLRYTRGAPQVVAVRGVEGSLSFTAIYTDEELENVYLLDSANSRIVEVSKTGSYQKQYLAGEIRDAVDFVVSKSAGKIFLLTPGKVLELPL